MSNEPDPLADMFAELPNLSKLCPLGTILADASELARERLERAITASRSEVPDSWIVDQLHKAGLKIGKESLSAHRRNTCRCVR